MRTAAEVSPRRKHAVPGPAVLGSVAGPTPTATIARDAAWRFAARIPDVEAATRAPRVGGDAEPSVAALDAVTTIA